MESCKGSVLGPILFLLNLNISHLTSSRCKLMTYTFTLLTEICILSVKVFLSDVDEKAGAATLAEFEAKFGSDNVKFMKLDVSDENRFEEVFQGAVTTFGQVDIMVNNAGVMNESTWQLMIKVNIFGVIKGTKLAEEHMRKDKGGKGGKIINISSVAGLSNFCILPVYSATKQAVRCFTISQAAKFDIQAHGIDYAVICPSSTDTPLVRDASEDRVFYYDLVKDGLNDTLPVSSIVEALLDLLNLECMNGAILMVDKKGKRYQKMELVDMGAEYASAVTRWKTE